MTAKAIRLFLLDDREDVLEGLTSQVNEAPDMRVVGTGRLFTPALLGRIAHTRANVVVVDIVLGAVRPEHRARYPGVDGHEAIAGVRERFKRKVGIVARSQWPHLGKEAIERGADVFVPAATTLAELREMIRQAFRQRGELELVLGLETRQFLVRSRGERHGGGWGRPSPAALTFLGYLALERREGERDWLYRDREVRTNWKLKNTAEWSQLCRALDNPRWDGSFEVSASVAGWAYELNAISHDVVITPGPGRGSKGRYSLNPRITRVAFLPAPPAW